jgi:carbonic anhydrase/acetyltransferase-like protein (isoleucine patch superfamily)
MKSLSLRPIQEKMKNSSKYIHLTKNQIDQLISQGCSSKSWNSVWITKATDLSKIQTVTFSSDVKIDGISGENIAFGGVVRDNGIYNAHIHNCTIGNNPFIKNVKNYIANYTIGDNVIIDNIGVIAVNGISTFGNGTTVEAINEGGGREIPIYDNLSAQVAYILALYRHRDDLIANLKKMIFSYTESIKSDTGTIGDNVKMLNCKSIKNVNIGPNAKLEGVASLKNGSLNSFKDAPVYVGSEVMAENFIISSNAIVDNATIISNCFVGQGCVLDKHYSAEHSVFFANSQGFNGEACSIFAGPYTVTHHKSTLLIAGMFSFMNAGSGSNQSNHMYKLGPIHQGIMERGAKTTSNSYLLWPSKIGAFTLVSGRHYKNVDSSSLPFSYLVESKDESILIPGINLRSVGTVRDAQKWEKRDSRHENHKMDIINFNLLSPFTIHKVDGGLKILKDLESKSDESVTEHHYAGMKIKPSSLVKGVNIYTMVIHKFLGNSIISRIHNKSIQTIEDLRVTLQPNSSIGKGKWLDVSGLLCPIETLNDFLCKVEKKKISTLKEVQQELENIHENYYDYEWNWACALLEKHFEIDLKTITPNDVISIVEQWKKSVVELDQLLYTDAKKEFSLSTQVGFGVDGNTEERAKDFASVRGEFNSNTTVMEILNHIERKTNLGNKVIEELANIVC